MARPKRAAGNFFTAKLFGKQLKIGAISSEILNTCLPDHLILSSFDKTASNGARFAVVFSKFECVSLMPETWNNAIAPAVERTLGKGEVACSITLAAPFSCLLPPRRPTYYNRNL